MEHLQCNPEDLILVGTVTNAQESLVGSGCKFVGIRFKPAAFLSFDNFAPLNEITDQTIEFERALSPEIQKIEKYSINYLNIYLLSRLTNTRLNLFKVLNDIKKTNGQTSIEALAKANFTTERQLE